MDNTREKLVELLNHEFGKKVSEITADWLLANGVTFAKDNDVPNKWIPASEPPNKMKPAICLYKNEDGTQVGGGYVNDHGIWTLIAPARGTITHWKPFNLPEPPKGE